MTPAQILIKAAQRMHSGRESGGACHAIHHCGGAYDAIHLSVEYRKALRTFEYLFMCRSAYWFGGGKPQHQLYGDSQRKTREHRTYALLLAACVVEDEQ